MFTRELHRRYNKLGVTSFAVHPGTVATSIVSDRQGQLFNAVQYFIVSTLWGRTAEHVVRGPAYVTISDEVNKFSGGYFHRFYPAPSSAASKDDNVALQLWQISEKLSGLTNSNK